MDIRSLPTRHPTTGISSPYSTLSLSPLWHGLQHLHRHHLEGYPPVVHDDRALLAGRCPGKWRATRCSRMPERRERLIETPPIPPRRRANKRRGIGTMENDRPPVLGILGRESGRVSLTVCDNTKQATIQPQVETRTRPDATVYTDESSAYKRIAESGRGHATVCHSRCVILERSGHAMMTAMVCGNCIATQWKAFGPACGTFSVCFAVSTKSFSPVMWRCLPGLTT